MTPEHKEAGEIARGLTLGQKSALRSVNETADGRVLVPSMLGNINSTVGWPKGLTAYYSAYYSRLTPLGLAVRTILQNEAHHDR